MNRLIADVMNAGFCPAAVLQPAVEAFFLVHATERESKPPVRDTRESQLSHIKDEPPPLSPAPLTPATPSSLDPFFSREPSSMHISANLPSDTQKFLRFAGESVHIPLRFIRRWLMLGCAFPRCVQHHLAVLTVFPV